MTPTILIIDDQQESIDLLVLLLKGHLPEARVVATLTGAEGLDRTRQEQPDLVLLDVRMPEMDGYEVCRRLKTDPALARIPVLMMSGMLVGMRHRVRGFDAGAEGYLCKPFEPQEFVAQVRLLLRLKRQNDELHERERDLEQRLKARTGALQESEETFRTLFNEQPDALFVEDEQGTVLDANPAGAALHGLTRAELLGRNVLDLVPPEHRETVRHDFPRWFTGEISFYEGFSWTASQRSLPVQIHSSRIRYLGQPALLLQVRDMTGHRQLEDQFRQSQKMEAVGRLAGGIAHDFNNLLTSILGFSHLLLDRLGAEHPAADDVREIVRAGERAADLTRQLLAFGRKQIVQKCALDFNATVQEMDRMLRRTLGEDIELVSQLDPDLQIIEADLAQMNQVLMNLAVNARDAMPDGGTLTVQTANVIMDEAFCQDRVGVKPGPYILVTVRDTGSGMDAEARAHAFEPFFTTKEKGKGTGLGLSTVYAIVRQGGGHIEFDTAPGAGTEFRLYFPAVATARPAAAVRTEARLPRGSETVLLVEDEDTVRALTLRVLSSLGYRVLVACNGVEALEKYGRGTERFQLVVTDVIMPQMGGPAMVDRLRTLHGEFRVLYTSGFPDETLPGLSLGTGGEELLLKPYTRESLAMNVRALLDRAGGAAPGRLA